VRCRNCTWNARWSAVWWAMCTSAKWLGCCPGMQSAFIDIGLERAAFLHVADVWHHTRRGGVAECLPRIAAPDSD